MTSPTPQRPDEEAHRGEHNELGYRDADEDRSYDEAGEQSPPGQHPAHEDDDQT